MRNLDWLYDTDETFREDVRQDATKWLGNTSANFAGAWLEERHHEEDEACLLWQHADVDTYEERIETQRQTIEFYAEELRKVKEIAEKYRADAIAAQKERDAYRDLCGRMRKMANEMLVMEVD